MFMTKFINKIILNIYAITNTEQAALHAADGMSATGDVGVAFVTSGPDLRMLLQVLQQRIWILFRWLLSADRFLLARLVPMHFLKRLMLWVLAVRVLNITIW